MIKIFSLPGLNKIQTAAEESICTNFRYYSEFELSLYHLHFKIFSIKILEIKNYNNKNYYMIL